MGLIDDLNMLIYLCLSKGTEQFAIMVFKKVVQINNFSLTNTSTRDQLTIFVMFTCL